MTPQERDLISDLFRRLRAADTAPKDRDADELIRRLATEHAGAPYLLVQTVLVQEQAMTAAQGRIEELQRQLAEAQSAARPSSTGGFLGGGGLLGAFGRRPAEQPFQAAPPPPQMPPQAGPWGAAPQAPQAGPWGAAPRFGGGGGGFLQSAMATAAGVAGGALLFEGIEHMMGGNSSPFGQTQPSLAENTTINNYYGDQGSGSQALDTSSDSGYDGGAYYDDV